MSGEVSADAEAEMRILIRSGMTWPGYWELVKARRLIRAVNWRLERDNSPMRWGVLQSSDPSRVRADNNYSVKLDRDSE